MSDLAEIFKKPFKLNSIKKKINISYLLIIFIPVFILTFLFNLIYSKTIINNTINESVQKLGLMSKNIDLLTQNIENYSRIIVFAKTTQDILRHTDFNDEIQILNDNKSFTKNFSSIIDREDRINSINMFRLDTKDIFEIGNNYNTITADNFISKISLQELVNRNTSSIWTELKRGKINYNSEGICGFSFFQSIMDLDDGLIKGVLNINIDEGALSSIYSGISLGMTGEIYITNSNGIVMSSIENDMLLKDISNNDYFSWCKKTKSGGIVKKVNGVQMIITVFTHAKFNWKIIGVVPLHELMSDKTKINIYILASGLLLFLFSIFISYIVSNKISKPIADLSNLMGKTANSDNLSVRVIESSDDEVGVLQSSFNKMMKRICEQVEIIKEEQRIKREYELSALNAQVRPHFLYNALNSICGLLLMKEYENTLIMLKALGEFYKLSLGKGKEVVSIGEEISLTESYIIIQKNKFGNDLTYSIEVPEKIANFKVPKFTIQPLVENSFKHGFVKSHDKKHIKISAEQFDNNIRIVVMDNGIGGKQELINNFLKEGNSNGKGGFGLSSIINRLKLYFGSNVKMEIETQEDIGMKVTLILPSEEDSDVESFVDR